MSFINKVKEVYKYRHMLFTLVKQDLQGRYKGSIFGFLWTLLNPLFMLLIYSIVFQFVFKSNIEYYPIYLFVSLMPWNAFNSMIGGGTTCVSNNASIIKKVYFPREVLPLSVIISNTIQYCFSLVITIIAIMVSGVGLSFNALFLPLIILVQVTFAFGLILMLSAANVYVRDVQYMMNPIMMIWMYASPILYSITMVPEKWLWLYKLNPMVSILQGYQNILYDQTLPDFKSLGIVFLVSLVICVIGYLIFNKLQRRFAEEV